MAMFNCYVSLPGVTMEHIDGRFSAENRAESTGTGWFGRETNWFLYALDNGAFQEKNGFNNGDMNQMEQGDFKGDTGCKNGDNT